MNAIDMLRDYLERAIAFNQNEHARLSRGELSKSVLSDVLLETRTRIRTFETCLLALGAAEERAASDNGRTSNGLSVGDSVIDFRGEKTGVVTAIQISRGEGKSDKVTVRMADDDWTQTYYCGVWSKI